MSAFARRLPINETISLLHTLHVMLHSGMPIVQALTLLEQDSPAMRRRVITHIRTLIEAGHPLAEALETSPRGFPAVAVSLVRTGELSGTLESNLDQVVKHLRKTEALRRAILGALLYPAFILIALSGLGLTTGVLVLPQLIPLFDSLDVTLPWTTRLLIAVAQFMKDWGIVLSITLIFGVIGSVLVVRLDAVKPFWHQLLLRLPVIGNCVRQEAAARMCMTLGMLLKSGIPLREALAATADATENRPIRAALIRTMHGVENGRPVSQMFRQEGKNFPPLILALMGTGEETGTLADMLAYLADYYEEQVSYTVKTLTTVLEPILLIGIGLIVGFTILSIISPIYGVTGSL